MTWQTPEVLGKSLLLSSSSTQVQVSRYVGAMQGRNVFHYGPKWNAVRLGKGSLMQFKGWQHPPTYEQ